LRFEAHEKNALEEIEADTRGRLFEIIRELENGKP
jgi:hypothetical protein